MCNKPGYTPIYSDAQNTTTWPQGGVSTTQTPNFQVQTQPTLISDFQFQPAAQSPMGISTTMPMTTMQPQLQNTTPVQNFVPSSTPTMSTQTMPTQTMPVQTMPTQTMPIQTTPLMPETLTEPWYTAGYLRTQIGKLMRVEFLIGNSTTDRVGYLSDVGSSFIILNSLERQSRIVCDIFSIKFVTIIESQSDAVLYSAF